MIWSRQDAAYTKLKAQNQTVSQGLEPIGPTSLFEVATSNHAPPSPASIAHVLKQSRTNSALRLDLVAGGAASGRAPKWAMRPDPVYSILNVVSRWCHHTFRHLMTPS